MDAFWTGEDHNAAELAGGDGGAEACYTPADDKDIGSGLSLFPRAGTDPTGSPSRS